MKIALIILLLLPLTLQGQTMGVRSWEFTPILGWNIADPPSLALNVPSGTQEGDIMFAFLFAYDNWTAFDPAPSGWTYVDSNDRNTGEFFKSIWAWKRASGSEPASYTFSETAPNTSGVLGGGIVSMYGLLESGSPVDGYVDSVHDHTAGNKAWAKSLTTTVDSTIVLLIFAEADNGFDTSSNGTTPTFTKLKINLDGTGGGDSSGTYDNDGGDGGLGMSWGILGTAGATGARQLDIYTFNGISDWTTWVIAFKPAVGEAPTMKKRIIGELHRRDYAPTY